MVPPSYVHGFIAPSKYTGWWFTYPSEKYEFVSWDGDSQLNGTIEFMFQITSQTMRASYTIVIIVICTNLANKLGPQIYPDYPHC